MGPETEYKWSLPKILQYSLNLSKLTSIAPETYDILMISGGTEVNQFT